MAAPESNIVTVDLRTQVPVGWTLTGLSEPRFDGVNFYRAVIDNQSALTWHSDRSEFIQIDYQIYSDVERINTLLLVDGHRVSARKFAAGRFEIPESTGFFLPPGRHTLAIRYTCSNDACKAPIRQYWTSLRIHEDGKTAWQQQVGVYAQRWSLDAPNSPLTIKGVGGLQFDGLNYVRPIIDKEVSFSWNARKPLNTSIYVAANQDFRVTTVLGGQEVSVKEGSSKQWIKSEASLTHTGLQSVTFRIECLDNPKTTNCAYLYFPQVTVLTLPSPHWTDRVVSLCVVMLMIVMLGYWLSPHRQKVFP